MKRLPWKYLAGLIDGEGCFDLHISEKKRIQPRLRISLVESCIHVLEMAKNTYGGTLNSRTTNNPKWQNSISWELVGYRLVCKCIHNIVPHLLIKQQQARLLLWMMNNLRGKTLSLELVQVAKEEMSLMKKDPHRLSEIAEKNISQML